MVEKNIIVDGDGTIYVDATKRNWQEAENTILHFARCVLKQPEQSPLIEYKLDYDKIRLLVNQGTSLEHIIQSLEKISAEPIPLSIISDIKMLAQDELVLEQENRNLTLSGNYSTIDRIAKKGIKGVSLARLGPRKLSIPSKDIPELKKAFEGRNIKGVNIANLATEDELLYQHGVPLRYIKENPEAEIKRSGGVNVVSSPNLEQTILEARQKIRQDFDSVKQKIPIHLSEVILDSLDSSLKTSKHHKSKIARAFIVLETILNTDLAKEFSEHGLEYINVLHKKINVNYKDIIELLILQGWNFEYSSSAMAGWDMKLNFSLYPERAFYVGRDKYMQIYAFLKEGPNLRNISGLRQEISTALSKNFDMLDKKTRSAAKLYFCDKRSFWDIQNNLELNSLDEVLQILISAVEKLSEEGVLSEDARIKSIPKKADKIQNLEAKEKPQIVVIKQIPAFIKDDKETYQRLDLFEREWSISLQKLKQNVASLEIICKDGNDYVLLSGDITSYLWIHTENIIGFVNLRRQLPNRAYSLLKDHLFHCNSLRHKSDEQTYLSLLEEMEQSLVIVDIFSKNLSPQFTRRRLFEAGMKFIPLYETYNELGIPSAIITEHFQNLIISLDRERGIIACETYRRILDNARQKIAEKLGKYSPLLPDEEAYALQAIFAGPQALTELNTCQNITKYKTDLDHIIIRSYDLLMKIPDQQFTQETKYISIFSLIKEYKIPKNIITSMPDIEIIDANGVLYAKFDQKLKNKLEKLKPAEQKIPENPHESREA